MWLATTIMFSIFRCTILLLWICKKSFSFLHFSYNGSFPINESNLDSHNNPYSFYVWALQSCSPPWDTRYWCFRFVGKAFHSTIFLIIENHLLNVPNLDSYNNLHSFCDCILHSCSPLWDIRYWCFGFARKAFYSTIFFIIKVHLWNVANLDSYNNLPSLCDWQYN